MGGCGRSADPVIVEDEVEEAITNKRQTLFEGGFRFPRSAFRAEWHKREGRQAGRQPGRKEGRKESDQRMAWRSDVPQDVIPGPAVVPIDDKA